MIKRIGDQMAGEKFIALEETSQEIKTAVDDVQTTADGIKTDTDGIKLSNESIKAVADTILERLGLTTDVGGGKHRFCIWETKRSA